MRRDAPLIMSPRNLPLVITWPTPSGAPSVPTLTVEFYVKWYDMYLVMPDGAVRQVEYSEFDEPRFCGDDSAYGDHVPNPVAAQRYALEHGYEIDELALELMVGRWEMQYHSRYEEPGAP